MKILFPLVVANPLYIPPTNYRHRSIAMLRKIMCIILSSIVTLLLVACHAEVEELTHLHGQSEADVLASMGAASYSNVMPLKQGSTLPELYMEIHNTYNPSDPRIEGVEIKELRWDRSGFTEAVFMHKIEGVWTVLESCRWKDGVKF